MIELTKELRETFKKYPLYSQDGKRFKAIVIAKFFIPLTSAVWLITEAEEQENGDFTLFGYGKTIDWEFGYSSFNEIRSLKIKGLLEAERDKSLREGITLEEALREMGEDVPAWGLEKEEEDTAGTDQ